MRSADNDGFLYPIPMNVQSVHAGYKFGEDETSSQIELSFEIPTYVDDSLFCMISAKTFTDFNMLSITGLIDADVVYSNIGAGSVTATIVVQNNTLDDPTEVEGLLSVDFISTVTAATDVIRNITDSTDDAITSVMESAPGVYDFTFGTAAAKVMKPLASLDGVDFSLMRSRSFTTV